MKVDVLVICYNQEQYIRQALESVLMQRVAEDVEVRIIIADDCSMDGTIDIVKETLSNYDGNFLWQILTNETNKGITRNYQRGYSVCEGDYIAILEGDDYWSSPFHLQQHISFLDAHRECNLSMNRVIEYKVNQQLFQPVYWPYPYDYKLVTIEEQIVNCNMLGNLSACVVRTESIKRMPESIYEVSVIDWMLGIMLSRDGLLALLRDYTSVYRVFDGGTWSRLTPKEKCLNVQNAARKYDDYLAKKYHAYFVRAIENAEKFYVGGQEIKTGYMPPIVKKIVKSILPPVLYNKIKQK